MRWKSIILLNKNQQILYKCWKCKKFRIKISLSRTLGSSKLQQIYKTNQLKKLV